MFTVPEASPESSRATAVVAAIVVETNEQPMPAAHSSEGTSTSAAQVPPAAPRASRSIPAASVVMPAASTRPGPQRAARRLATCVQIAMTSDIGASVRPVCNAE
jgi:hypothetical protein